MLDLRHDLKSDGFRHQWQARPSRLDDAAGAYQREIADSLSPGPHNHAYVIHRAVESKRLHAWINPHYRR